MIKQIELKFIQMIDYECLKLKYIIIGNKIANIKAIIIINPKIFQKINYFTDLNISIKNFFS